MFSMVKQKMNQYKKGDRKGKGVLVDDGYDPYRSLEHLHDDQSPLDGVDTAMLASQEIQGPPTPAQSHGCSVVVEKEKEKPEQLPDDKPSILLFTTHIKPRLRWTPKLHARFTDAINELGGAAKATPKAVQTFMDLDGLTLFHVKSHLQKFRMGKVTVKELKEVPKIRPKISTCRGNRSVRAKGRNKSRGSKVRKTSKARKGENGELYLKLQEAQQRYVDNAVEDACKKLVNQYIAGANAGVASVFMQNLAGVGTMATTSSFYSTQQNPYPPYNTLERIKDCLGLQKQPTSSGSYQPQNSDGYSFPAHNTTNTNNVQVGLKEKPQSFLPQNVTYPATRGLMTSLGYSYPVYNPTNAINVHVGLKEQPQSFMPQNEDYSFQPQNAAHSNQSQKAANGYQPQNAVYFVTKDFPASDKKCSGSEAYSAANTFPSSNRNYSGNTAYSTTNNFPTNMNHSGIAAYSTTSNFPTSNGKHSGNATYSATPNFPTSDGNYSGSPTYSATNNFPTSKKNHAGSATYSATDKFPTSNVNPSGSAAYSATNNFPTSNVKFFEGAAYSATNNITSSNGIYPGTAASVYSAINNFTTSNENYSVNKAYSATKKSPPSNEHYSGTEFLEDLTAALASIGNKSILGTLDEDPVDTYMNWDNPEPNTQDADLSFTNPYGRNN